MRAIVARCSSAHSAERSPIVIEHAAERAVSARSDGGQTPTCFRRQADGCAWDDLPAVSVRRLESTSPAIRPTRGWRPQCIQCPSQGPGGASLGPSRCSPAAQVHRYSPRGLLERRAGFAALPRTLAATVCVMMHDARPARADARPAGFQLSRPSSHTALLLITRAR